jgi:hypothetical protein
VYAILRAGRWAIEEEEEGKEEEKDCALLEEIQRMISRPPSAAHSCAFLDELVFGLFCTHSLYLCVQTTS